MRFFVGFNVVLLVLRFSIDDALSYYSDIAPKGEIVIIIEGKEHEVYKKEQAEKWIAISYSDHMDIYINKGHKKNEAMKFVASDRNMKKREVYDIINKNKGDEND